MSIVERVADLLARDRADLYRCGDCAERVSAPVGESVATCPHCGSEDVALVTRRTKV
ncbi:hypothetical protein [Halobaculum sp. EA56]|uniref:hypothetical protein n=1 Tax=Halobaculum sp. EA56 TaxID=3421648 RepID=UPI003EBEE2D3